MINFSGAFLTAARRLEDEKQRELEEKERVKQQKATEGLGVLYDDADGDGAEKYAEAQGQGKSALEILREKMKKKELKKVDHAAAGYIPIKKDFYREHPDVAKMDPEVVKAHLRRLEIKIRGKNAPTPLLRWEHAGLDARVLLMLQRHGFAAPFAIQAMALPALMAGRDIIGVAKTGSGKTVAFLLPLFRHVLDQPKLGDGEGPIGLIMAPARELAVQIFRETKKFTKVLSMRAVAVYGGSAVSEQINAMKRGAEIVVATPGRFIDLLTLNAGKLISLSRVSYLVLDEADRMFDMGFEPQIAMVTKNIRPDRQTAMFSATFPSHVERLARKLLKHRPLEIIVGGRSKVASEIEQFVEVRGAAQKFLRLLQILGLWQGKGSVLVFTDTQALCDEVYTKLMQAGYYCLSLHSGKDQADRDQTIADFKNRTRDIMVATSLAGRGLDIKSLSLVVNYSCPNHLEDYVQRCGRTGRAGNKGTAFTFVDPATEEQFVPDVVKALNESDVDVPQAILDLQEQFLEKVKAGTAKKAISGCVRSFVRPCFNNNFGIVFCGCSCGGGGGGGGGGVWLLHCAFAVAHRIVSSPPHARTGPLPPCTHSFTHRPPHPAHHACTPGTRARGTNSTRTRPATWPWRRRCSACATRWAPAFAMLATSSKPRASCARSAPTRSSRKRPAKRVAVAVVAAVPTTAAAAAAAVAAAQQASLPRRPSWQLRPSTRRRRLGCVRRSSPRGCRPAENWRTSTSLPPSRRRGWPRSSPTCRPAAVALLVPAAAAAAQLTLAAPARAFAPVLVAAAVVRVAAAAPTAACSRRSWRSTTTRRRRGSS